MTALVAVSAATLWAGRRQAGTGLAHLQGLGRTLGEDMRGFFLAATAGLTTLATILFIFGLLAPLLPGNATRVLATGLALWGLAMIIHHRRGAAWGADIP